MEAMAQNLKTRPPVIVVMGHIDHGKSTLLDYIRNTNTTDKEAGGITQHIAAYEVEIGKNHTRVTFLDTPGHEAFCAIRERGSKVADIAILVVSAEDGVKPQTVEALECIKHDNLPFIVAINKIDKSGSNVDKTKQSLAEKEVLVEGWGGTIPVVSISAKTGENVQDLLEMIELQAEIIELKGDPTKPATGFVIESDLNPQKGISATLLIKEGSLKKSEFVATTGAWTAIKMIETKKGILLEASFSTPVKIAGWNNIPIVGSEFKSFKTKDEAMQFATTPIPTKTLGIKVDHTDQTSFPLIIKADTLGSLEAITHELNKIEIPNIYPQILSQTIGAITENDVKSAGASRALILGFNVAPDKNASILAMRDNIEIKNFSIIYELTEWLKTKMQEAAPKIETEEETGKAKILKTFSRNKKSQVIGGRVETGEIRQGANVRILRRENHIGDGKIKELQSQKIKTGSIAEGQEFGALIESKIELVPGDIVSATIIISK